MLGETSIKSSEQAEVRGGKGADGGVWGPLSGDCAALISKFIRIRFVMLIRSVDGVTCPGVEEVR